MSNETQSFNTLKSSGAFLPYDRVERIENLCVPGMPDVNCCCEGVDAWIEIKTVVKLPKRATTALIGSNSHPLSQEQANWLLMHHRAGGRGFVYIDSPNRRYLIPGYLADDVNAGTPTELMLAADWSASVPTPRPRWEEFRKALLRGR